MGRFLAAQPAWGEYTGQSQEEYQGLGWLDAVHPDDQASRAYRVGPGDGERRPLQATGRLWHAESREHRHVVARATPVRSLLRRRRRVGRRLHGHPRANARRRGAARAGGGGARDRDRAAAGAPARPPRRSPRLALAAHYEAGSDVLEVGGDWYDAFQLPDGRIGLDGRRRRRPRSRRGRRDGADADRARGARTARRVARRAPQQARRVPRTDADDRLRDGLLRGARSGDRRDRVRLGRAPADAGSLPDGNDDLARRAQSPPLTGLGGARRDASTRLEPGSLLVLYSDGLVERAA